MQRRKEAMAKARKRRRRDIDIRAVDDHIMAMIREMRQAVDVHTRIELGLSLLILIIPPSGGPAVEPGQTASLEEVEDVTNCRCSP